LCAYEKAALSIEETRGKKNLSIPKSAKRIRRVGPSLIKKGKEHSEEREGVSMA